MINTSHTMSNTTSTQVTESPHPSSRLSVQCEPPVDTCDIPESPSVEHVVEQTPQLSPEPGDTSEIRHPRGDDTGPIVTRDRHIWNSTCWRNLPAGLVLGQVHGGKIWQKPEGGSPTLSSLCGTEGDPIGRSSRTNPSHASTKEPRIPSTHGKAQGSRQVHCSTFSRLALAGHGRRGHRVDVHQSDYDLVHGSSRADGCFQSAHDEHGECYEPSDPPPGHLDPGGQPQLNSAMLCSDTQADEATAMHSDTERLGILVKQFENELMKCDGTTSSHGKTICSW